MRVSVEAIHAALSPTSILKGSLLHATPVHGPTPSLSSLPVIVYLHEALGSMQSWAGIPERVASALPFATRSIVYDRLGHGESTGLCGYGTELHGMEASRLKTLLGMLKVSQSKILLVGHSDGATISLVFAASGPRTPPAGLFLIAPHVTMEQHLVDGVRATMTRREALIKALRKQHGDKSEALVDAWGTLWCSQDMEDAFDIRGMLKESFEANPVPMMAVHGMEDPYGTLEVQVDPLAELGAEVMKVHGAGHSPHLVKSKRGHSTPNEAVLDCLIARATKWLQSRPSL